MICDKQNGPFRIGRLEILDPVNIHQVVRREIDPQGTNVPLAESPEPLPRTEIHPMRQPKARSFGARENPDFATRWHKWRPFFRDVGSSSGDRFVGHTRSDSLTKHARHMTNS